MHAVALILLLILALANTASSQEITHGWASVGSISTTSTAERPDSKYLVKRKGGGGGGGRGGGGGGRSRDGNSGSSSSSGSRGPGGSASIAGGRTTTGSGTPKFFGGYYGGGAAVPYTSGYPTPAGLLPAFLTLSVVSLFFPGPWLYNGIYAYTYADSVRFSTRGKNVTLPLLCLCQESSVCGCDENDNEAYVDAMVANATMMSDGNTVSKLVEVNGTQTLVVNGTLANGTTADGGTDIVSGAGITAQGPPGTLMMILLLILLTATMLFYH